MFLIMDSGISLSLKSKQMIRTIVQLMHDGYAVNMFCITHMIIMSDILMFQIIFTLTSEQYVCNLSRCEIRKPEKIVPNFSSHFHGLYNFR